MPFMERLFVLLMKMKRMMNRYLFLILDIRQFFDLRRLQEFPSRRAQQEENFNREMFFYIYTSSSVPKEMLFALGNAR